VTRRNTFLFAIILYFCVLAVFLIMNRIESSVYGLRYKIVKENRIIDESTSRKIDLKVTSLQNHFDVNWSGILYAPITRLYPIQGAADDRLELRIDGNVAVDATPGHAGITRFIPLHRGFHRIEADYSQFTGDRSLILMMNHSLQILEFIDPPAFFPEMPSSMQLFVARLVTFLRGVLLFWCAAIPLLAIIAYFSLRSPRPAHAQHAVVRVMRVCVPSLIILYAALLRFEALTIKHGIVTTPALVRILQEHTGFVRYLHPKTLQWIPGSNPYEKGDPINYLRMGRAMKSFYAAQFREPFYVFMVKQFLRFFDQKDIAVSFASAFFSVLAVFATFLLAYYAFSWWVGVLASLGMAIDSELISIGADGWRDDTFMFLVLMFSYALLRLFRKASFGNALFAGIVAGLVCLTRMTSFSFIVPGYLFVLLAGKEPSMKHRTRSVLLSASIFCILIAPFLINCAIVYGDPLFSVNDNTKFYRSRENIPAEQPKTVARYLTEKLLERPYKFIDTGFVGLTRYPFLNKWKGINYLSPVLSKILAGCALLGTILFLFSSHGRLLLVLLISSLIPYAFTYEIAGGFEWRFTMHAYPFYMIAGALFLVVAFGALCIQNTWSLFSERALSKKSVLMTSGVVLFVIMCGWFLLNQSNFLRKQEAIMADEAILIESGQRDFRFFNSGWYPAVQVAQERVRITKDTASLLTFPLKAAKEYNLILRANPVFEKGGKASFISVFVNDRSAGQIEVKETADSAYVLRLPQDFVKDGINQIGLRTNRDGPNIALQYYKVQPVEAFQRAMDKYEKNEFDEAIPLFEQAIQQAEKRRAPVFYYLGMCYLKKDQPAKAIEYFNKALPLSRGNQQILEARGEAYLKTKQYDAAAKDLTKVLKSQPNNENVKRLLSLARESRMP
jgi:Dolichyl-phosphate-mannose-protein mannosyltransferase/Tetratricopeptide repeat